MPAFCPSLLDAYLNEVGITSRPSPTNSQPVATPSGEPNDKPGADGSPNVDRFAALHALHGSPRPRPHNWRRPTSARHGRRLFNKVGCDICHVQTSRLLLAGTKSTAALSLFRPLSLKSSFIPTATFLPP